jgi:putative ABC transport system permease protein
MKALNIKLWRDLQRLRAQVATIALVVACGVAGFVAAFSTHRSLEASRDTYYRDARFADLFAGVKRAPVALAARIAAIDGVAEVQLDTVFDTQIDVAGVDQPMTGRMIGLEPGRARRLNTLRIVSGRLPERGAVLEAVLNQRFAQLHRLRPGSTLTALLNGRRERLHVVGTVLSPEYVYATRGTGPDDETFGVFWIDAERLATAFSMQGAFNRVSLRLSPGVAHEPTIAALDRLLEPYGATGAVGRELQLSASIVENELRQQQVLGTVLPSIFLAVAVFILNVVLSRQVATQRQQIAALKALGYGNGAIAGHYIQLALAIAAVGVVLGLVASQWLGRGMVAMYAEVFRFGTLHHRTAPEIAAAAVLAVLLGAALGAWTAIRAVVRLSPAQAMQPASPPKFRPTLLELLGWGRKVAPAALMIIRNIERRPLRSALTVAGIAAAVGLQISGTFWNDTIARIVDTQYRQVLQGDVLVDFAQPVAADAAAALQRLPGVLDAEVYRAEPVRASANGRSTDIGLLAYRDDAVLMRAIDVERGARQVPRDGVMLSALLARELGVAVGDTVEVEFRLGHRRRVALPVVEIVHTMFGRNVYMELAAMNRLAGDGDGASNAVLRVDPHAEAEFYAAVKATPRISAVFDKGGSRRGFEKTTARNLGYFSAVFTLFAVAMAIGITYNAARIALSERSWELASLRVLGMTRAEVSVLLLAELGVELLVALPIGAVFGWALAHGLLAAMKSQEIDFPLVVDPSTYGVAALTVLAAGVVSALVVRRQVDRLDLVAVLKVRE